MNAIITSQPKTPRNVVRVLQTIFTVLACASLVIGSALISYVWFRMSTYGTVESTLELTFLMTIVYLIPTLLIAWLFATTALLLARRWVAAGLSLPLVLGVFLALYLFIVFVMPHVPAVVFVALLVSLNGVALWLARRFLNDTAR